MLTNSTKYALRAVIYLGVNQKEGISLGIKKISEDLNVPTPFLSKILQVLARQKILISAKGPNGGFALPESSFSVKIRRIVEIMEGNDIFDQCLLGSGMCTNQAHSENCPMHSGFSPIREAFVDMFEKETIKSIVEKIKDGKNIRL